MLKLSVPTVCLCQIIVNSCCKLQLFSKAMSPSLLSAEDAELKPRKAFKSVTTNLPVGRSQMDLSYVPLCTASLASAMQSCQVS